MRRFLSALTLAFPLVALAAYDTAHLPYGDAPSDRVTAVAVSFLTGEGIVQGYPDGTFRPDQSVNRAEFLKVAMRASMAEVIPPADTACFPDIDPAAWYAPFVCAAKRDGLVSGDALDGIDPSKWRFHPARQVNYAEAVKILVLAGNVPPPLLLAQREWYEPFLVVADREGIALPDTDPGTALTRAQVAKLAASFLALSRGELPALRAAQEGRAFSSSSSQVEDLHSCDPYICPDGAVIPSCSSDGHPIEYFADPCLTHQVHSSSSQSSRVEDPRLGSSASSVSSSQAGTPAPSTDPGPDFSSLPTFIRLGTTSSILGAAKIFNDTEPFVVTDITVNFTGSVPTVDDVRLYATADHRFLGSASRDADDPSSFVLQQSSGILSVGKREDTSVYARAIVRAFDDGGSSGEDVRIDHFTVAGHGGWSNRSYSQSTTETYQAFETARSTFTSITNAGPASDALLGGASRTLGAFRFVGSTGDGRADLRLTDLTFALGTSGNVSLTNVELRGDGSTDQTGCIVASATITCSAIPASVGTAASGQRTLTLTGDITVSSSQNAGLQVSLTPAGSASSAGAITWTDGTTSFQWVPVEEAQLRGTFYQQ